ncbi:hypothetical protein ACFQY7_24640 [Actinomadura luteofluorescens]|uniref:hypothetical protein n=1 Tax=Actinomadura luteofluorescens TaxID=46163 RepID=UPI0036423CD1
MPSVRRTVAAVSVLAAAGSTAAAGHAEVYAPPAPAPALSAPSTPATRRPPGTSRAPWPPRSASATKGGNGPCPPSWGRADGSCRSTREAAGALWRSWAT